MSLTGSTANLRKSRGLRAFGLFVAVWLNLALAPCGMAYEAIKDHDCPDCPPADTGGHHGMHDDLSGSDASKVYCADELADCMIDDEVSHDGRSGQPKFEDGPHALALSSGPDLRDPVPAVRAIALPRYAVIHPGAPPPIHLLNCVFLD